MTSIKLSDNMGRSLDCILEDKVNFDNQTYYLVSPVDYQVEIIAWSENEDGSSEATLLEDSQLDEIYEVALEALAKKNLTLKRTAHILTVSGEMPEPNEDDILMVEIEDDDIDMEPDELQFLTSFFKEEQEYAIYTPLHPILFCVQYKNNQYDLVSPEEFSKINSILAEKLLFEEEEEEEDNDQIDSQKSS